jgi:hypothetical protein
LKAPERIGTHRVSGHNQFIRTDATGKVLSGVYKLNEKGVEEILSHCAGQTAISYREVLLHQFGKDTEQIERALRNQLSATMKEYNPENLPPIDISRIQTTPNGPVYVGRYFAPRFFTIDGAAYAVETSSLGEACFDQRDDMDLDELLAV